MTRHRKDRALLILDEIRDFTATYGYPPTVRELQERVQLSSTSAVHHHLLMLRDAGFVSWEHGKSRSLRVIGTENECPTCGRPLGVAA